MVLGHTTVSAAIKRVVSIGTKSHFYRELHELSREVERAVSTLRKASGTAETSDFKLVMLAHVSATGWDNAAQYGDAGGCERENGWGNTG